MFAVIRTGGKQYRVQKDDVIKVERLAGEPGATVALDQVLMVDGGKGPTIGSPLVDGASVAATVLDQARADKILVFKKKRRKNYRRMHGHRQDLTVLRITDITVGGKKRRAAKPKGTVEPEVGEDPPEPVEAAKQTSIQQSATEATASDQPETTGEPEDDGTRENT